MGPQQSLRCRQVIVVSLHCRIDLRREHAVARVSDKSPAGCDLAHTVAAFFKDITEDQLLLSALSSDKY
jgi:hypothetical protein